MLCILSQPDSPENVQSERPFRPMAIFPQRETPYRLARRSLSRKRVPWLLFLAITVMVYSGSVDWRISAGEAVRESADLIQNSVASGDFLRQAGYLTLGFCGFIGILRSRWRITDPKLAAIASTLILWATASTFWSVDPSLSVRRLILAATILLGALWMSIKRPGELPRYALFSSALIMGLGVVAECVLGTFHPFSPGYRFAGTFHPNHQAINAAILFFAASSLAQEDSRYRRGLLWVAGIALGALFLTKSRTAVISFGVVQLGLWITGATRRPRTPFLALSIAGLTTALVVAALVAPTDIRSGVMLGRDTRGDSMLARYELWTVLYPYVEEKPLTGFGYGAFWTPDRVDKISDSQRWGIGEAHSSYLDVLLALGLPGLLLIGALFLAVGVSAEGKNLSRASWLFTIDLLAFSAMNSLSESAAYGAPELHFLLFWSVAQLVVGPAFPRGGSRLASRPAPASKQQDETTRHADGVVSMAQVSLTHRLQESE
jgi:exopolysaccharide production protein ExoQ